MNEVNVRLLVRYFFALTALFCQAICLAATASRPGSGSPPLTVLMDFESPHSETSLEALSYSLNKILGPGGIAVDVQLKSDLPENPQFGQLVVFKMKGSCSLNPLPSAAKAEETGPLASAFTSDGQVLHFGEVQCDRVRRSLQRVPGFNASLKSQQTYGAALAIVIAHEVYHMLGNAKNHTRDGLTKKALTAFELSDSRLALPPSAVAALQKSLIVAPPSARR